MKTKVELCEELGILDVVRHSFLRIWQDDPTSWDTIDEKINNLTNDEIIAKWCSYEIGDDHWWWKMKNMFDFLNEEEETPTIPANSDAFTPTANYQFLDVDINPAIAEFEREKSIEEIDAAIDENLSRYDMDLQSMLNHVRTISDLTKDRSGFYGIKFPVLKRRLEERINLKS